MLLDANEITLQDIEAFLMSDGDEPSTSNEKQNPQQEEPVIENKKDITNTQAFAHRLKKETEKVRNEERNTLAKELGYESYEEMKKAKEAEVLLSKGLDPDEVAPVVEQLLQKRLNEDPRLKELEEFRQEKVKRWADKELEELKELTNGRITKMADVPADVIEQWKKEGSLKAAYLKLEGEKLIKEIRLGKESAQSKGSKDHLKAPQGSPEIDISKRPLTDKEKSIYKLFNPNVTDEELSKKLKDK